MATRYSQVGSTPSPTSGGASELATTTSPVAVSGAAAPVAGQVLTALSPTTASWQARMTFTAVITGSGSFPMTVNRTNVVDTGSGNKTLTFPVGPVAGDRVAVKGNLGGSSTISLSSAVNFETSAGAMNTTDSFATGTRYMEWMYDGNTTNWRLVGFIT